MAKYTIEQFRKDYPNDAVCLDKLFKLRFGTLEACPGCGVVKPTFRRVTTRRCYQCRDCYHQLYPTAGTIFEKTTTPLTYWFYAMYLMTVTRNGVSAKELERALDITYKTAWRMAKLLRELMGRKTHPGKLKGIVEMDETYYGIDQGERGMGRSLDKTPIFAMVERMGRVVVKKMDRVTKKEVFKEINDNVEKGAKVMTDEFALYTNLKKEGYPLHKRVKHALKQYREGDACTNTVEGFFSHLKRMIKGTHLWVSRKYLQLYADECAFRYNNRHRPGEMFNVMISGV